MSEIAGELDVMYAKVPATAIRGSALNAAGSSVSEPVIPRLQFLHPPLVRVEAAPKL